MNRKLILPSEVKVCATCSYWDGERRVDEELEVVVVHECCQGECLVREEPFSPLTALATHEDCLWEPLAGDEAASDMPPAGDTSLPWLADDADEAAHKSS